MLFLFALMSDISATVTWITVEGDDTWKSWKTHQVPCPDRTQELCNYGGTCDYADSYNATCFAVQVECSRTDYCCRARELCQLLSGEECLYDDYSCYLGFGGSYYVPKPIYTHKSIISFACGYDFVSAAFDIPFGNICDCYTGSPSMEKYGLYTGFMFCGSGHWYREEHVPPTTSPSVEPTYPRPSSMPTDQPSFMPTTGWPSFMPTTDRPSLMPTTDRPSFMPSINLTTAPSLSPLQTSSISGSSSTNTTLIYLLVASSITIFCCLVCVCYLSIKLKVERKQHGVTATMIEGGEGL